MNRELKHISVQGELVITTNSKWNSQIPNMKRHKNR